ncbi:twitching motility protein PilT [candidate division MSBL1 archaeon SCGC-AAA259J03]|uniref:Twitching motility protein PilT n=2 Tax=candidate division MSBL1 TaxID=215777 RepID=A0A133UPX1_9EURY|nr:twitching motility protein PilT [candidate division MSBL1 archaeon SCGC-AAA259I14]KXA96635.1 twitching motility protein PilT [candidate division MSBL1 archaeon SCGC-AAA259J03]
MRFVDASVFVHAYLKPKRELEPHEKKIKEGARRIIQRIEKGEEVSTSVVHLSETANILEGFFPLEKALSLESSILTKDNIRVMNVSRKDYLNAMGRALEEEKGLNDLLAYVLMKKENQSEIYSFDKDFDEIEGIERINE